MCSASFQTQTYQGSATALVLVCSILRTASSEIVRDEMMIRVGEC